MPDFPETLPSQPAAPAPEENDFAAMLAQYEGQNESAGPAVGERRAGSVVNVREDSILVDIGAKAEGVLPLPLWRAVAGEGNETAAPAPGEALEVVIEGRDADGSFKLSLFTPDRPRNVDDARLAFDNQIVVRGKVLGVVKGGLSVDIGMRAFLPASRTGVRDPDDLHKLVGQEIRARILRPPEKSRVVIDRRGLLDEEQQAAAEKTLETLEVGAIVDGTVTSVATYGAFVDIGGLDALLHVSDMSWTRLDDPASVMALGNQLRVQVLKIDTKRKRISVGLKQMTPDPWTGVAERYHVGERVRGPVKRLTDFGAFVALEPGVEGLIHISEMSWTKRVRKPEEVTPLNEVVEAVVLGVQPKERRISLGLKQALGDPWADAETRFKPGTVVEGRVRNLQQFGAFVELAEGVDGMIHIGDISSERLKHPSDVLKLGDTVKAQVLELDLAKRRLRLGMKQLEPTPQENWIKAHQVGEVLTGRVIKAYPGRVELDEGIDAACPSAAQPERRIEEGSLAAKLAAVWKPAGAPAPVAEPEPSKVALKAGEVRKFRIVRLETDPRLAIEVEPA